MTGKAAPAAAPLAGGASMYSSPGLQQDAAAAVAGGVAAEGGAEERRRREEEHEAASLALALELSQQEDAPHHVVRSAAGQFEEALVERVTAPGGLRAAPRKEELAEVCESARSLDLPLLLLLLTSKVESEEGAGRLRALHVLEALLRAPDAGVAREVHRLLRPRLGRA